MSRIGKLPVPIPNGVTVSVADGVITAKGPKGELSKGIPPHVSIETEDGSLHVKRADDSREARSMHGLARSLVRNVVHGVSEGFIFNSSRDQFYIGMCHPPATKLIY